MEYAHNAFRYFHRNVPSSFQLVDNNNRLVGEFRLSDVLFRNATILQDKYDVLLNGMLKQAIDFAHPMYTPEVKSAFFTYLITQLQFQTQKFLFSYETCFPRSFIRASKSEVIYL